MKVLIAGGSGFLGRHLTRSFLTDGHEVLILTRGKYVPRGARLIHWDARSSRGWEHLVNDAEVIINLAGKSLASWPWTRQNKQSFYDSRIMIGQILVEAVQKSSRPPKVFVQQSGINHYGFTGAPADETTSPGDDFLSRLTVDWENATAPVEKLGVRRIVLRSAVVLGGRGGLFPIMALPVRLFLGGPLGDGGQALPWIHIEDWVAATRFLIQRETASGVYNLISPVASSNSEFTRSLAEVMNRPYWIKIPHILLRVILGEMSDLVLKGRIALPSRLINCGYQFKFAEPQDAFQDLCGR